MARSPETILQFADGEYLFRLNLKQVEELQEKCDAGPSEVLRRLMSDTWRVADVRETIRLGLIGGGLAPAAALTMVRRYVDDCALAPNVIVAIVVMQSRLYPFEDEPLGKAAPAAASAEPTPAETDASPSPTFTASAPPSDSAPAR